MIFHTSFKVLNKKNLASTSVLFLQKKYHYTILYSIKKKQYCKVTVEKKQKKACKILFHFTGDFRFN
ncbi:hypothetical protein EM308_13320 [Flavobacterium gilvum]|uniref:Uncharacterized protein n=1 Tax=Flavobacterium gilvum TaxID=1492737 RepID=A0AAC9I6B3_9FLAO|nr:hypothetical protein EM308_13320 [Flavobacterium gilvum]